MRPEIDLSIIIPAYNEADRIVPTIAQSVDYLKSRRFVTQLLVVSDGSRDNTVDVVEHMKAAPNVLVEAVEYHPNRGKGYAVRYGMLRGKGRVVMFMDADYAVPIEYCEKGMALIDSGCDIAIASRAISGARIEIQQNLLRMLSAKLYTFIQNRYLGIDYPDTQCGFKLFTRPAARDLFQRQKLDSVIFDPEILWLARRRNYRVGQFPVEWRHVADSRIQYDSLGKSLFVFQELLRIKGLHKQ